MKEGNIYKVSWADIYMRMQNIPYNLHGKNYKFYGIPRGGQIVAGLTGHAVDTVEEADIIVDDIFDSGRTAKKYKELYNKPMYFLFNKQEEFKNTWLVMPWENTEQDIQDTVIRQLEFIGEDASREGLIDTPKRVIKSWDKLYGGYKMNPKEILKRTFTEECNEMVVLKQIEFFSTCEHHLLPFWGSCSIGYIPDKQVVGISKLARLMECFTRRLQIQERLTRQIVNTINEYLKPKGVICIMEAQHLCMTARGIEKQHSKMVTSALRGVFEKDINARQEFFKLIER